jgi:hypothetical protein
LIGFAELPTATIVGNYEKSRLAQEAITGMESILWVDRAFSPPPPRKKKNLKERYLTLRDAVLSENYTEARRLIEQFDGQDYTPWS